MEQPKIYRSFTELEVWQSARAVKLTTYELVKLFPDIEKYRLCDQLIRAVRSIPANIAEGYGRFTYKDQLRFCMQARGSLFETQNHIIDAFDCQYIQSDTFNNYKEKLEKLERLLNGYIAWLKRMADNN